MDFALNEDQRLIRETARQFAGREIALLARANEHNDRFPVEIMRKMAPIGLLGGPIPTQYGGAGIDSISYALLCEEIGKASVSVFTSALTVQVSLVAQTILRWGTEEQKHEYLPHLCSAGWIGAYALTEPNAGSDPASMETLARLDGDEWVLNGSKMWTSNGAIADLIIVFAQTKRGAGHRGVIALLVHTDSPGFSARTIEGKMGLSASNTAQLFLDNVRVPRSRVLSPPGTGFKAAMTALDNGRLSTAACAVGIGQGCLDAAKQYALTRQQFGKPIAAHQLVQEMVADMATETEAARLLVLQAADRKDRGEPFGRAVSMAKYFASEMAVRAARNALQIHGGYGYSAEFPVEQYLRDAIALTLYEGTSQIQKLIIGREILQVSAFR
ncbi:MAG: acyl-CoA dehydrogenase family protein [Dehalococcoidia bacterium]